MAGVFHSSQHYVRAGYYNLAQRLCYSLECIGATLVSLRGVDVKNPSMQALLIQPRSLLQLLMRFPRPSKYRAYWGPLQTRNDTNLGSRPYMILD